MEKGIKENILRQSQLKMLYILIEVLEVEINLDALNKKIQDLIF